MKLLFCIFYAYTFLIITISHETLNPDLQTAPDGTEQNLLQNVEIFDGANVTNNNTFDQENSELIQENSTATTDAPFCEPAKCTSYCLSVNSTEGNCVDTDCVCKIENLKCDEIDCGEHCWIRQKKRGYCRYNGCNCIDDDDDDPIITTSLYEEVPSIITITTEDNLKQNASNNITNNFYINAEGDIIFTQNDQSNNTFINNSGEIITNIESDTNEILTTNSPSTIETTLENSLNTTEIDISSNTIPPDKRADKGGGKKKRKRRKRRRRRKKKRKQRKHRRHKPKDSDDN